MWRRYPLLFVKYRYTRKRRVDNRFLDFEKEFHDSQINKENAQIVELTFRVVTYTLKIYLNTCEMIGDTKIEITEVFIESETAYGGDVGLKLYLKYETMQLVRRFEDIIMCI